ncbi:MAG: CTP synthetase [Paracoccaceae bacterium]
MRRLALILFGPIASTLASVSVVAALVAGAGGLWPLLGAAAFGGLLAVPVTLGVARRMTGRARQ